MERLDRCKSMERRKPYSQTLSVENESTHKNHKTSLRLRKCNSSVGSAATFSSRARSRPAYGPGNQPPQSPPAPAPPTGRALTPLNRASLEEKQLNLAVLGIIPSLWAGIFARRF